MNGSAERIPELDGLRGIAILMVLTAHLSPAPQDSQHWLLHSAILATRFSGTGVDLFFVLSGFLICGILVDNRRAENYFKVFYLRRAFRILPLYFLITLSFFTLSFAWHHGIISAPAWLMDISIPRWTYLTFTHNFAMAHLNSLGPRVLVPTWSLAVEEQFYLTLPFIVWFVPRRFLTRVLLTIMAGAIFVRIAMRIASPQQEIALMVLTACRADALILGALIAIAMRVETVPAYLKRHRTELYALLGVLILCVTIVAVAYFSTGVSVKDISSLSLKLILDFFAYTGFALIYGTLILIALTGEPHEIVGRICRSWFLRKVGTLAYCIYLIHSGVICVIMSITGVSIPRPLSVLWLGETILILAIVFLIATVSWTYFEQPLIKYGHRFRYESPDESAVQESTSLQGVAAISP